MDEIEIRDRIAELANKIYDTINDVRYATRTPVELRVVALRIEGYARIMNEYAKELPQQ